MVVSGIFSVLACSFVGPTIGGCWTGSAAGLVFVTPAILAILGGSFLEKRRFASISACRLAAGLFQSIYLYQPGLIESSFSLSSYMGCRAAGVAEEVCAAAAATSFFVSISGGMAPFVSSWPVLPGPLVTYFSLPSASCESFVFDSGLDSLTSLVSPFAFVAYVCPNSFATKVAVGFPVVCRPLSFCATSVLCSPAMFGAVLSLSLESAFSSWLPSFIWSPGSDSPCWFELLMFAF